ncbi:MAG TPA: hypothetical protein PLP36_05970 [Candidatus Methanoculleus thermohydrogenotrophicum]|nr:hypothetical protein [Candidatus Methanoculleus thermohydrogenotrophicum]
MKTRGQCFAVLLRSRARSAGKLAATRGRRQAAVPGGRSLSR